MMGISKLSAWIIGGLIVMNLVTLTFMWVNKPPRPHHPNGKHQRGEGPRAFRFIVNELRMDEKQEADYAELRDQHHEKVLAIQDKMHEERKNLFSQFGNQNTNIHELCVAIGNLQTEMEEITFNHFADVRALCKSDEQVKKFDEIILEAVGMILRD